MLRRDLLSTLLAGTACVAFQPALVRAQEAPGDYPSKPVTIIVPFAAGGNTDAFGRLVAQGLDEALGQRFLVDNKPGAAGNIGAAQVARAEPDGYTLGMGTVSTHAINPSLYAKMPFDAEKDFAPISLIATLPNVLVVNPAIEAKSVPELIELLKSKPGELTFASSGIGSSTHVAGELFMAKTGTEMIHVPYKGSSQAMLDVVAGHVDLMFDNIPTAAEQVKAGTVRGLAVTSLERSALLPDLPPMAEFIPGFDATSWHGLFAPAGTPLEIVDKLSAQVQQIMKQPQAQERLQAIGAKPIGNTPVEFVAFIAGERAKWAEVIKAAGVTAE